uniref:uncharacterized protein LOC122581032 n=1 Tax=Erigeron canadensis TaxID=72917 RepID=UPI001CB8F7EF|nr:uncharacterized protein LOC122581032 [Erigeron canadensis]
MARCKQYGSSYSSRKPKAEVLPPSNQRQRDLEDKFARMRLTQSPPRNVPQTSFNKPPSAKQQSSRQGGRNKKSSFWEYEHGYAPVVPSCMYDCLQDILGYLKHLETHPDDLYIQKRLKGAECRIKLYADYLRNHLPKDWKYDRATAGRWKLSLY